MYTLYQVQLETKDKIYSLEVPALPEDCDAVELAEIFLAIKYSDFGPFHLGGYCSIGYTKNDEIKDCTR